MLEKWKSFFKENRFLIILSILIFVYTTYFYNKGLENVDEGVLNVGASRIAEGEIPYRDFFIPYTPLSFYYVALFFKLFGTSLFVARFSSIFVSFFYIFTIFLFSLRFLKLPFSIIPIIFLTHAGMASWHISSHHFISNIFTIIAFYFLSIYEEKKRTFYIYLCGVSSSISFLTLNDQGAFTILFLLFLIFLKERNVFSKDILFFSFANLLIIVAFFSYLLLKVPIKILFYDLIIFPFTGYKALESNSPNFLSPFILIFVQLQKSISQGFIFHNLVSSITSFIITLMPIITIISFIFLIIKEKNERRATIIFLFFASLTMILTALRRFAPINLIWATPFPSIFISYVLQLFYEGYKNIIKRISIYVSYILIIIFSLFGISYLFMWQNFSSQVKSKNGKLYLLDSNLAQKYNSLLNAIDKLVKEEDIFCEALPSVYFLTKKNNPTKIDFFRPPHYTPPKQIEEVIQELEKKKVNFIITFKKEKIDDKNPFEVYLFSNFSEIWDNQFFSIYKRKSQ